jgi:hypothetical protein
MGGNLTFSGDGSLTITTSGRSIHLDGNGAEGTTNITFKDSVNVTTTNQIFTEGGESDRPAVIIDGAAALTCHGLECGNGSQPIGATERNFLNTNPGGGEPGGPGEGLLQLGGPFNLYVGEQSLVLNGVVQPESIDNLEIIYYEHSDSYSLRLQGGSFDGIYTEGEARIGIYVEDDSTIRKLTVPGLEDYSMALSFGGDIAPHDFLQQEEENLIFTGGSVLTLEGGILSNNSLAFKDDIIINIGSLDQRANKGIVGDRNLNVNADNPGYINIWANDIGVENVNTADGFKLTSLATLNINSLNKAAEDTDFILGEGAGIFMNFVDRGNFVARVFKWEYIDMERPLEEYINQLYTVVENLSVGDHPEDKYILNEDAGVYMLTSTGNRLYTLGYNYDNNRDGIVDNPDEEIRNGRLSIKGAKGTCTGNLEGDGFIDYHFEAGTPVTIELLPDYGYQYEAGTLVQNMNFDDPIDATPGERKAFYTFIMPENHIHLYAGFVPSDDIIETNAPVISDALVDIGQNNINGNVQFTVDQYAPAQDEVNTVAAAAGDMETGAYLELNLNEYIKKAGTDDAWVSQLSELAQPVEVSLELSEELRGKSEYKVVRIHNGVAEVLDASYSDGKITFETNKFSTYVIIYEDAPEPPSPSPTEALPSPTPPVTQPTPVPPAPVETTPSLTPTLPPSPTPTVTPVPDNAGVKIEVKVPADDEDNSGMTISSDIIQEALEKGENVVVTVKDENDNELYTWIFDAEEATGTVSDVNLTIEVQPIEQTEELKESLGDNQGLVLSFGHDGELPATATVRIYVGNLENIEPGMQIYLYHCNKETGKLETLPYSSRYTVDEFGFITVNLVHCSDYVVLKEEASVDLITSLRNQMEATVNSNTLYVGGSKDNKTTINIKLPATLVLVDKFSKGAASKAKGEVTASYSSNNAKVAKVAENGTITAVGKGKAVITVTLTLYSGKIKSFKFNIVVKDAYVNIENAKASMKVKETYTFVAKAYGFDLEEITWTSDKMSVVSINKITGKATAKAKGTAYITAKFKKATHKIKVTVK